MMPTYSITKIATEAVVRTSARLWRIPTVIARLGVPYGDNGGWPWYHLMMMRAGVPIPIHPSGKNRFPLYHEDDYVRSLDALLGFARVPATTVNWAGSEDTTIEEWCRHLGTLTGLEPKFEKTEKALAPLPLDVSLLESKAGRSQVSFRTGLERMVRARNPELLKPVSASA
jgi:nucleoside-diphosphate-sugar epimerase